MLNIENESTAKVDLILVHSSGKKFYVNGDFLPKGKKFFIGRGNGYEKNCLDIDLGSLNSAEYISRSHAYICRNVEYNCYMIVDNNSSNGTFLNQQRLTPNKPYPLNDKDILELGRKGLFKFTINLAGKPSLPKVAPEKPKQLELKLGDKKKKSSSKDKLFNSEPNYDYSIHNPFPSEKTISELIEEGYMGVELELSKNKAFVAVADQFKDQIKWTQTKADKQGDVALMTLQVKELGKLLELMLDKFGWCPPVYSNKKRKPLFIFTPNNELENMAIEMTISGEYGWKGSLYSLDYLEQYEHKLCFIFATKPKNTNEQEWLLVEIDITDQNLAWSVHPGTLEQVYYIWAEEIEVPQPNFNPSSREIQAYFNYPREKYSGRH